MAIITERFLATYKPPEKIREFTWRFYARGRTASSWPYYEIRFVPRFREFKGDRVEGLCQRALPESDIAKLRAMLSPDDIADCTIAGMEAAKI